MTWARFYADKIACEDYSGRVVDIEKFPLDIDIGPLEMHLATFELINRLAATVEALRGEIRTLERNSRHKK